MSIRMTTRIVTFAWSFSLDEIDHDLPAGIYTIETDEETLGTTSFLAYRRVETRLFIPPPKGRTGTEMWVVDPEGLERAIARDAAISAEANPA